LGGKRRSGRGIEVRKGDRRTEDGKGEEDLKRRR